MMDNISLVQTLSESVHMHMCTYKEKKERGGKVWGKTIGRCEYVECLQVALDLNVSARVILIDPKHWRI